jgi:hypothetical protein
MPGADLKSLGLSLCLPMGKGEYLPDYERGCGVWTLMNLTTFFPVS